MTDTRSPMLELLSGFISELREAGLPVSLTENLDAMEAITHIPIEDRDAFKYALAATLVKNHAHWRAFETVFEVYFSLRGGHHAIGDETDDLAQLLEDMEGEGEGDQGEEGEGVGRGGGGGDALTPEELAELVYQALMQGSDALLRAIARQAVRRFAGMEPGRPVGGTYYLYRTLRNLDLDAVLERLMEQTRQQVPEMSALEERLERDEYEIRVDQLRKEIEAEIRRRLVADRGVEAMARTLRKPLPEDIDFMHASREEMLTLRRAIYPLTRKLAVRLARKRRHGRKGPLDFRNTVRHSLSYGGVPAEPKFKYPRPSFIRCRRGEAGPTQISIPHARRTPSSSSSRTYRDQGGLPPVSRCPSFMRSARSSRRCGRSFSPTAPTRCPATSTASTTSP